jgi:hypothetical protein
MLFQPLSDQTLKLSESNSHVRTPIIFEDSSPGAAFKLANETDAVVCPLPAMKQHICSLGSAGREDST